jgi:hypothetical protein
LISISSPNSIAVTPVVVDADDVTGVELKLLRMMEVNGQVIVEGGGAPVGIYIRSGPTSILEEIGIESWPTADSGETGRAFSSRVRARFSCV